MNTEEAPQAEPAASTHSGEKSGVAAQVMTLVRASDVTIHAVGFLEHQPSSSRLMQRQRLAEIAETTGGQAFFPTAMKDVEAAYDKIVAQIRNQYTLGYKPTNTRRDGTWRTVSVKTNSNKNAKKLVARSKRGYYAPAES